MSTPMTVVPNDHPMMIAYEEYKLTPEYANTLKWAIAASPSHAAGTLWASFREGWVRHDAAADELRGVLLRLVVDVQDYPAWQRPCAALDQARELLRRLNVEPQ